ncbi:MAG: hypothetical protein H6811_05920 [Phycisphaeraceae bacterium]|nr:hypothetical protein [Phycisphaeraceae bacterium]
MLTLRSTVARGKDKGIHLWPHRHDDGQYVASPTKFESDYIRVPTIDGLIVHYRQGLKIRMSNPNERPRSGPSLIDPQNLEIVDV